MDMHSPWPQIKVCNRIHSYRHEMLKKSGKLCVDRTDIGISDHFLLWLELGCLTKHYTKGKHVIKKWCLDRFEDKEIVIRYIKALSNDESNFTTEIRRVVFMGMC